MQPHSAQAVTSMTSPKAGVNLLYTDLDLLVQIGQFLTQQYFTSFATWEPLSVILGIEPGPFCIPDVFYHWDTYLVELHKIFILEENVSLLFWCLQNFEEHWQLLLIIYFGKFPIIVYNVQIFEYEILGWSQLEWTIIFYEFVINKNMVTTANWEHENDSKIQEPRPDKTWLKVLEILHMLFLIITRLFLQATSDLSTACLLQWVLEIFQSKWPWWKAQMSAP